MATYLRFVVCFGGTMHVTLVHAVSDVLSQYGNWFFVKKKDTRAQGIMVLPPGPLEPPLDNSRNAVASPNPL